MTEVTQHLLNTAWFKLYIEKNKLMTEVINHLFNTTWNEVLLQRKISL